MISLITLEEIVAGIILLGSLVGALTVILKPIKNFNKSVSNINERLDNLDKKFDEFSSSMEKRQSRLRKDMHMSMIISKYVLDCSTDTSDKGKEIRDEFNDYLLNAASGQEDDANA